ncbi:hypothetical protein [Halegenticoccus tardaugens]|uniref:hypothetical protein n=1 Tax=Halegenticoccus tardaugens TaxID=2071624 RepID=UPI00100A888C|nr:hypothetical protein [Halegenticoccus tardaugens]
MTGPQRSCERTSSVLLLDHSLLSLSDYLAMQRSVGNETRFRILERGVRELMREEWEPLDAYGR